MICVDKNKVGILKIIQRENNMKEFSTYKKDDVIFLLKDISDMIVEEDNMTREKKIQSGTHYSEMIPIEYQVSDEYLNLYRTKLKENKEKLAFAIGVMSEKILKRHDENVVLVSLARAGTPIGILAKRYIKQRYNLDLPHYTISIIRDRGIDINEIKYICERTFYETFSHENTKEDMENYLKENFSYEQLESEINNKYSKFYIVKDNENVIAYMKVNFDKAQTEPGHHNTLEIQRIYILQEYKGKHIGKKLIQKTIEIGKENNLYYIWLGVWEHNINAIRFYEKQGFEKFDTHIFKLGNDEQTDNLMKLVL